MNYTDSGQTEGQALMGFEFPDEAAQFDFINWLSASKIRYTAIDVDEVL